MPRAVRKVTVYVCTLNGQIYLTAKEAKAAAAQLREKAERRVKRARKGRGDQTRAILRALQAGHDTPLAIKKATKVPPTNVNPTLHRLRKQGLVDGAAGTHRLTAKGKARLAELGSTP